ncbi:MAG: protein-tyrosine-phosphatase [Pseudonocardiaceae bacterium]|nr:protein-tyrosine-phosphatase [Pseudonocardiaceae bacterium]
MRWIELEGAVNVRDIGGLPTEDGGHTMPGRLLRADNLQDLSSADVTRLVDDLEVRTIIDLRSPAEVTAEGPGPLTRIPQLVHRHHSLLPEAGHATDASADALLVRQRRAAERYPGDRMSSFYLGYLEDRPDSVLAALRSITNSPGSAVVHCAAGKDRTGVVVALALTIAGVSRETVIDEYAVTGERIEAIMARLRASPTYAEDVDRRPASDHKPQPETMAAFLTQLDERHGGVFGWLDTHNFGEPEIEKLRSRLRG